MTSAQQDANAVDDVMPCVHCGVDVRWDESALDYRHVQPTDGCPMALEPLAGGDE